MSFSIFTLLNRDLQKLQSSGSRRKGQQTEAPTPPHTTISTGFVFCCCRCPAPQRWHRSIMTCSAELCGQVSSSTCCRRRSPLREWSGLRAMEKQTGQHFQCHRPYPLPILSTSISAPPPTLRPPLTSPNVRRRCSISQNRSHFFWQPQRRRLRTLLLRKRLCFRRIRKVAVVQGSPPRPSGRLHTGGRRLCQLRDNGTVIMLFEGPGAVSYVFCMSFQISCGELFALGDCGSGIVVVVLLHMRAHNVAFPQHAPYRCITRCLQINLEPGSLIQNGKGDMSSVVSAAGELSWTLRRRYRCVCDSV
jgi:hypothetical protein